MRSDRCPAESKAPARLSKSIGEVCFLGVQKERFVESANRRKGTRTHEQNGADRPRVGANVWMGAWRLRVPVTQPALDARREYQDLGNLAADTREPCTRWKWQAFGCA